MRSKAYAIRCIKCNGLRSDVGKDRGDGVLVLSNKGLCPACSRANMIAQQGAETIKDPEWLQRWREGIARSVGATIPPKGNDDRDNPS